MQEEVLQALRRNQADADRREHELSAESRHIEAQMENCQQRGDQLVAEAQQRQEAPGDDTMIVRVDTVSERAAAEGERVLHCRAELQEASQRCQVAEGTCERVAQAHVEAETLCEEMADLQKLRTELGFKGVIDAMAQVYKAGGTLSSLRKELDEKLNQHYDYKSLRLWRGDDANDNLRSQTLPGENARRQLDDIEMKLQLLGTEVQLEEAWEVAGHRCETYSALQVKELLPAREFFDAFFQEEPPTVHAMKQAGFNAADCKELLGITHPSEETEALFRAYFLNPEPSVQFLRENGYTPAEVRTLLDLMASDSLVKAGLKLKGDQHSSSFYEGEEIVVASASWMDAGFFAKVAKLSRSEAWAGNFIFVRRTGEGATVKDKRNGRFLYKAYALEWAD